jgi:DNA polymerase I-like protein with 3'-5' exonuclease and polymerase domains
MLNTVLKDLDPNIYLRDDYLVLDLETDTSYGDFGRAIFKENGVLLGSYKRSGGRTKSIWADEFSMGVLMAEIQSASFVVAHNAKYELGWFKRCGLDLHTVLCFCTQLGEYTLMGNLAAGDKMMLGRRLNLDACCRRRGYKIKDPVVDIMIKHDINPTEIPRPWLQGRCEQDVETTEDVFLDQRELLRKTHRLGVALTRNILTPVLADIEFTGMCLDEEDVDKEFVQFTKDFLKVEQEMNDFTGGINWKSPKQIGEFLYNPPEPVPMLDEEGEYLRDKEGTIIKTTPGLGFKQLTKWDGTPKLTPAKKPMTNDATLDALKAKTKRQKEFVALRRKLGKLNAALTKSLQFFQGVCKEKGGIFNGEFNQTTTATHRLSASGIPLAFTLFLDAKDKPKNKTVQFQNLARAFKYLFKARNPGWLMGEADGSQLEFRVAAFLGQDVQAIEDIKAGHDVHRFTASVLNQVTEPEVTKPMRQTAKADTFKPLYGGSQGTKAQMAYYEAFRERYPQLAATQAGWVGDAVSNKMLITDWGMRYYWPYASISRTGYCNVTSSVYNYPIQALATAEIIPIALTYFWHRVQDQGLEEKILLVNTVHDSIICEVHPDYVEEFTQLSIQCFGEDVYNYLDKVYGMEFNVPLGAGVTVGDRWSRGVERSFNLYRDGTVQEVE